MCNYRSFEPGLLVLYMILGLTGKLNDSWCGPWEIITRFNSVNYKIVEDDVCDDLANLKDECVSYNEEDLRKVLEGFMFYGPNQDQLTQYKYMLMLAMHNH